MESFHWNKSFETGFSEVDQQHHHLVDLINKFGEMLTNNEVLFEDIERLYKDLSQYVQHHFFEEEAFMLRVGIDSRHLDSHANRHCQFLNEVTSIHQAISPDNLGSAKNLLNYLTHWLAFHILGTDQNMARQIKSISTGLSSSEAYNFEELQIDSSTEPLLIALNSLFEQVSARNKELVELNQTLEEKVADRTKALSEANRHLEEISLTDMLTGLPNRRHALHKLGVLWEQSIKGATPLACMIIDADHFKKVNDSYGHNAGDIVLCELAKTIQDAVRSDDIACRLGGDEFFVICPDTDEEGGLNIAEYIRKMVSELHVAISNDIWHGSISIGLATRAANMKNVKDLIKIADNSVYMAKRDGKNCVRTKS